MIYIFLVDFNDKGDLYRMLIETNDLVGTTKKLCQYSHDVRYIGSKDSLGNKDKGARKLTSNAIIRRTTWFGSKIGYKMRFETSEYKKNIIKQAKTAEEVINGLSKAAC